MTWEFKINNSEENVITSAPPVSADVLKCYSNEKKKKRKKIDRSVNRSLR